jgi:hypothetical protein
VELEAERKAIDAFIADLTPRLKRARASFDGIMRALGRPTAMVIPRERNWFLPFHRESVAFDLIKEHHLRNVLLIALRFRWRPDEILALWQNEGLPSARRDEDNMPGRFLPVRDWYGREPRDEKQARAWAISAVLWERWGLDKLIPHSGADNHPRADAAEEHAQAFDTGFASECRPYMKDSPYSYLADPTGAIELRNDTGLWLFRTRPEYQATVLALQGARFKNQLKRIPPVLTDFDAPVFTRTVFPAALYMHYNSPNAEKHFRRVAGMMVASQRETAKSEYDGSDLYRFFTRTKLPLDVEKAARRVVGGVEMFNGHSWVNALRYEFIRRLYAELFVDFAVEELTSAFLVDE